MSRLPANVSRFIFEIINANESLQVLSFEGRESLSFPFCYCVVVACDTPDISLEEQLYRNGLLTLIDADRSRQIHGVITQAEQLVSSHHFSRYRFTLEPKFACLDRRFGHRIFQQQTVRDTVTQVLKDAGLSDQDFAWELKNTYPTREYVVQYAESDYAFIARLLADDGIHFHFRHQTHRHEMVFADANHGFQPISENDKSPTNKLRFCQEDRAAHDCAVVSSLRASTSAGFNAVQLKDYLFQKPSLVLAADSIASQGQRFGQLTDSQYRRFDVQNPKELDRYQRLSEQRHHCSKKKIRFISDSTRLAIGHYFELTEHPKRDLNQTWLVVDYKIEGKSPQSLESFSGNEASVYRCAATAIPRSITYRPEQVASRPKIKGIQTAVVTGPNPHEIYTDKFGRIKIQFHWDREAQMNERSSCWVRVKHASAGKSWGAQTIPRVGQEVIVTFEEGDPSRPIVMGSVYNGVNRAPFDLPSEKARSGVLSQSSQGGPGYQELRIDDSKGKEKILMRAEKNLDVRTNHVHSRSIGNDYHKQVKGGLIQKVGDDQNITVGGEANTAISGDVSLSINKDMHLQVDGADVIQVGKQLHIKAGSRVFIQASRSISLNVAASFITLDASGVSISGPLVRINEGGSAKSPKSAKTKMPMQPSQPDDHNSGALQDSPGQVTQGDTSSLSFQQGSAGAIVLSESELITAAHNRASHIKLPGGK